MVIDQRKRESIRTSLEVFLCDVAQSFRSSSSCKLGKTTVRGMMRFLITIECERLIVFRIQIVQRKIVLKIVKNAGVKKAEISPPIAERKGLQMIAITTAMHVSTK